MGQEPDEIRQGIERTRAEMGETVEAIGYKANVPGRAKEKVSEKVDDLKGMVRGGDARRSARRAVGLARENPLGLVIGAAALGFLAGLAAPSTKVEDERLGPVADRVRETGQEALERGRQVAQEATQAAVQTARERGQEQGQELADSARQSAEQVDVGTRTRPLS